MTLLNWLRTRSAKKTHKPTPHSRARLRLEALEDRAVPAGFAFGLAGPGDDTGRSVALDSGGNIYVAGRFEQTVDFDPGPAVRSLTSEGGLDYYVAKYDSTGGFQWARRIGGTGGDATFTYVTVGTDDAVRVTTTFTGTASITGINQVGTGYTHPDSPVTAAGQEDALVGVFDPAGTVVWSRQLGGVGATVLPRQTAVTPDGSVLIAGSFMGSIDVDRTTSHPGNPDLLTSAGGEDVYLAKLGADGSFAWARRAGGTGTEAAQFAVDAVGNAYLHGGTQSSSLTLGAYTVTRGTARQVNFLGKMDPTTGDMLWVQQMGGSGAFIGFQGTTAYHDPNEPDPARGNSVVISGVLRDGDGPTAFGDTTITRLNEWDGYIGKLDGDGNWVWAKHLAGWSKVDMGPMTTDAAGNVYSYVTIAGTGPTDFDPGLGQALLSPTPGATSADGVLLKLDSEGDFVWARKYGLAVRPVVNAAGEVHLAGTYDAATSTIDIGTGGVVLPTAGGYDSFVARLDQSALGGVFGRVVYSSGYPAAGAAVVLKLNGSVVASTTAGSFGEFNFRYLAAGIYTLDALGVSRSFSLTAPGQFLSDQTVIAATPTESTKFFVVNDGSTDRTYQYGAVGSTNVNTALTTGNTSPRGAASNKEGTRLWVVDANKKVYVYNSATGALLGSWSAGSLAKNAVVEGITVVGNDVWLVDSKLDRVYRYANAASKLSGSQNATSYFQLHANNISPKDLVTDGTSVWVVDDQVLDRVYKYTLSGTYVGRWDIDTANSSPTGITIDPNNVGHIWVVDNVALKVFQYSDAASRTSGSQRADRTFALAPGNTNPQGIADPPPAVSVVGRSVLEGNSGRVALTFTVSLSWASSEPVTFYYKTLDGTARAGSDYEYQEGSLTFDPGETTKTIWVKGDTAAESGETFNLDLFADFYRTQLIGSATGTIVNDDAKGGKK